jgi:hypothetical protein
VGLKLQRKPIGFVIASHQVLEVATSLLSIKTSLHRGLLFNRDLDISYIELKVSFNLFLSHCLNKVFSSNYPVISHFALCNISPALVHLCSYNKNTQTELFINNRNLLLIIMEAGKSKNKVPRSVWWGSQVLLPGRHIEYHGVPYERFKRWKGKKSLS